MYRFSGALLLASIVVLATTMDAAAATPPAGVVVLKDRCQHDSPQLSSSSATRLVAQEATQTYNGTARSAMRFAVSSLDLTTPGRYCQAVGDTVPDFISTAAGSNVTCATSDAVLTSAKRTVLLSRVVPLALEWLTRRLAVVPVSGSLALGAQGCGLYTMPTGTVSGADALVLVSAAPVASPLNASEWVRGAVCQYDQNGRPTVIVLNVAPDVVSASVGAASSSCAAELGSYGNAAEQSLARSVAHALVHGLGFSHRYMTARLPQVGLSWSTRRGKAVQLVTSPAALGAAQAHFGCDRASLAGVELEDQGLANATVSSHWEARNHGHDLMSAESTIWVVRDAALADQCLTEASEVRTQRRFTNVTLGLLKDFGFYTVNASAVEETTFGKGLGCAFLNETCNRTSQALWSSTYCNQAGNPTAGHWCAADRRAVGNCPTSVYSQALPWPYRYFTDAAQGGTQELADYCPMPAPVFTCSGSASRDSASLTALSRVVSVSGVAASRCVTYMDLATTPVAGSPLFDGALCANMRCLKDAATAQLTVQLQLQNTFGSDEWTTCDNDNTNSTNVNFVTVRYNSSTTVMIACPPAWEVCGSLPTNITAAPPPTTTMAPATTCAYTCPDGNCATDMASCACLADNNLFVVQTLVQLNGNTTRPQSLDVLMPVQFRATAALNQTKQQLIPAACIAALSLRWRVRVLNKDLGSVRDVDLGSAAVVVPNVALGFTFPANYFTVGASYSITATVVDSLNRTASTFASVEIMGVSGVPVVEVQSPVVLGLPYNVQLRTSVVDPYRTAAQVNANVTWFCAPVNVSGSNETQACPTSVTSALQQNGSSTGVFIYGPIPAGTYRLWLVYRGEMRSGNITLTVACNATDLTTDGKCPGKCAVYQCPDKTCAFGLDSCECLRDATVTDTEVSVLPVRANADILDPSVGYSFKASGQYRVTSGLCASVDLRPYLRVTWKVMFENGTEFVEAVPLRKNQLTFAVPARHFADGTKYTVVAQYYNLQGNFVASKGVSFTSQLPKPTVSLKQFGSRLIVGPRGFRLSAVVTDPSTTTQATGVWRCVSGVCGAALLEALAVNGSNSGVYVTGPVLSGVSQVTLTYRGVESEPLTLDVRLTEVPRVRIFPSTKALLRDGDVERFLESQRLVLASVVEFPSGPYRTQWLVNGVDATPTSGSDFFFVVPASLWTVSSSGSARVVNNVTLVATSTADPSAQGLNTFLFTVEPPLSVQITAVANADNATNPLLATVDSVSVSYAPGSGSAALFDALTAAGVVVAYEVGFVDESGLNQRVSQLQAQQVSFKCPYLTGFSQLTVYVELRVDNAVVANRTASYAMRLPPATAMAATQEAVLGTTDPVERASAASNIAAVLEQLDGAEKRRVGELLLDTLTDIVSADTGSQPTDGGSTPGTSTASTRTNQLLSTVANVLTSVATADSATRASFAAKAKAAMDALAVNVGAGNVDKMCDTLNNFPPGADAAQLTGKVASSLGDNLPPGAIVVAGTDLIKFVATKSTAAGLSETNLSPSNGTNITMAPVPGLDPAAQVSVNAVESSFNSLESGSAATPLSSNILDINLRSKNQPVRVNGLTAQRIRFSMATRRPATDQCGYFDETATGSDRWARRGVYKMGFVDGKLICETEHLTSFAALPEATTSGGNDDEESFNRHILAPTLVAVLFVIVALIVGVIFCRRQRQPSAAPKTARDAQSSEPTHV